MNEREWRTTSDVRKLLKHLGFWGDYCVASPRKLRLFLCAAARRLHPSHDVTKAELFADQRISMGEMRKAVPGVAPFVVHACIRRSVDEGVVSVLASLDYDGLADILREVVGPLQLPGLEPVTPFCKSMADSMYAERDFSRLPVLADALSDNGVEECHTCTVCEGKGRIVCGATAFPCFNCQGRGYLPDLVLAHLRSSYEHCLGCWALDVVRGET